jgi:putative colanic acid biosynthesis UDP-glucose lipid carrier transferase
VAWAGVSGFYKVVDMQRSASMMRVSVHVVDWLSFAGAGALAYLWRFEMAESYAGSMYAQLIFGGASTMLLVSSMVYRSWRGGQVLAMLGRVGLSWAITWGVMMTWLVLTQTANDYSRLWLGWWAGASLLLSWLARVTVYLLMSGLRSMGVSQMRVLLVGSGDSVAAIRRRVKASAWTGFKVVGVTPANNDTALDYAITNLQPDEVWIFLPPNDAKNMERVLGALRHSTANIRLVPDMSMLHFMNHGVTTVLGVPMIDISNSPMAGMNLLLKWLEDKLVGLFILLLIAPLLLVIAAAVKLTSPGPALFRQKRHGWNGEEINIFKFRSMFVQTADTPTSVTQATKGDPRITPLGRFLRSTSLDELPQFLNVLQGDMSIVGPRPHAVAHNLEYREHIPRYMLRHKVKPGITGWAQVNGFRGETDTLEKMEQRVQADLYYIENWSLWLDFKIIVLTIFKGFTGKNAY